MFECLSRTDGRDGRTNALSVGFAVALASAIALLVPPAKAAFIGSHSGNSSVNCPLPGGGNPSTTGSDVVTVTCNDSNSNDGTVDITVDFGADPFDLFFFGVQAFPQGNILYDLRIVNNSGQDWTDFHYGFPIGDPFGLTEFDSTDIVFDAGGGSLDSFSFGGNFLDLNFATAVATGTGFDIAYTLNHGFRGAGGCGTCTTRLEPTNTFEPPTPTDPPTDPPAATVPAPTTFALFGFGLAGLAFLRRRRGGIPSLIGDAKA